MDRRNPVLFILIFLFVTGCAQHKNAVGHKKHQRKNSAVQTGNGKTDSTVHHHELTKADSIVAFAKKFLGVKYKYGGETSNGFDCAGFVCFVYGKYGVKLPRTADAQELLGKAVKRESIQTGDLVFFKGRNLNSKSIGHVGIVVENYGGKIRFISATVNSGIHIDDIDGTYWKERYVGAKRILIQ